ncbi:hypothetical protein MRGA327_13995 [Mycobacterium tuberculosis RGTB327]|nr:hypothetical protein MRGA423_14115 [Mycobacterium tuberculosis RGTB423]AFE17130.1 hypothetical protein MRGA327_13995 [Mycobacterium tuberculosis RGTB327]AGL23882.1 hypothetical protein I917_16015 [Mycobacterium tuberculosis str. Haarlem/NITR202]AGQ37282.1 hypothetical protein M943_11745 [Mycobacterium tuberculosis EAI5]EMT35537.1 hypothetical protein MORY_12273 [Mycobacterium orygis 112400015]ESK71799.1 hypothetical protein O217_12135 [Mycobacterium tuberculosis variant bovis AN5]ESK75745.
MPTQSAQFWAFRQQVGLTSAMVAGPVSAGRKRLPITAPLVGAITSLALGRFACPNSG